MKKHPHRRGRFHRRTPPGAPPGVVAVDPKAPKPIIHLMAYGPEACTERMLRTAGEIKIDLDKHAVTWIHVCGLGDASIIQKLGELFGLHGLALEDVVNVHQTAKVEDYTEQFFIVLRRIHGGERFSTEQVSLFLGQKFVVSFQERPDDCFDMLRARLREPRSKLRASGADFLAYSLIDTVIDGYYPVLEEVGERLDYLEDSALDRSLPESMHAVHDLKGDVLMMRRCIWPLREAIGALSRVDQPLIAHATEFYLRDCYDHAVQLLELLETYHEMATDLREYFLSAISYRTNETMRVLTVIATIFIPLTFIVGLYGMNFNTAQPLNMPELNWRFGYPAVWAVMIVTVLGMLRFFHRKGWIGAQSQWQFPRLNRPTNDPDPRRF